MNHRLEKQLKDMRSDYEFLLGRLETLEKHLKLKYTETTVRTYKGYACYPETTKEYKKKI